MPYCEIFLLQVTAEPGQQPPTRGEEEGGGGETGTPAPGSAHWVPQIGERSAPGKIHSTVRTLLWVGFCLAHAWGGGTPQTS